MGLFDFLKPRPFDFFEPPPVEMTPQQVLAQRDRIIARAKKKWEPQLVLLVMWERVCYGWDERGAEAGRHPEVTRTVLDRWPAGPKELTLSYGGFSYLCVFSHRSGMEPRKSTLNWDTVSISHEGQLIYEAQKGEDRDDFHLTAYLDGDPLRNLVAAARAIYEHYNKWIDSLTDEGRRREAAEARKKFGI